MNVDKRSMTSPTSATSNGAMQFLFSLSAKRSSTSIGLHSQNLEANIDVSSDELKRIYAFRSTQRHCAQTRRSLVRSPSSIRLFNQSRISSSRGARDISHQGKPDEVYPTPRSKSHSVYMKPAYAVYEGRSLSRQVVPRVSAREQSTRDYLLTEHCGKKP